MRTRAIFTLLTIFLLISCSSDKDDDQKSILDKTTHEVAEEAVAAIQDPLDKARNVATQVEEHERRLQEQSEKK